MSSSLSSEKQHVGDLQPSKVDIWGEVFAISPFTGDDARWPITFPPHASLTNPNSLFFIFCRLVYTHLKLPTHHHGDQLFVQTEK